MAFMKFTVAPGLEYMRTVDDGPDAREQTLQQLLSASPPFAGDWIEINDGWWIRRDAIVAVHLPGEEGF